jgi:hypothetical protein
VCVVGCASVKCAPNGLRSASKNELKHVFRSDVNKFGGFHALRKARNLLRVDDP